MTGILATHAHFRHRVTSAPASTIPRQRAFFERLSAQHQTDGAYGHVQATRPDTLAAALNDSPAGLLAWLVEKLVEWSDTPPVTARAVERRISRDRILTEAMIYWVDRRASATSFRPYFEGATSPDDPAGRGAGGGRHPAPRARLSRERRPRASIATCASFDRMPEGGHFTVAEVPAQMRDFARELGLRGVTRVPSFAECTIFAGIRESAIASRRRRPATRQQRRDLGVAAAEVAVRLERILRSADAQQTRAETVAVLAREPAVLAEPLDRVGVEHLAPDVRVVAGAVAAREHVREVGRRVARRHGGVVEADVGECRGLERGDVVDLPPRASSECQA